VVTGLAHPHVLVCRVIACGPDQFEGIKGAARAALIAPPCFKRR
jgi:hypothetical protein